MLAREAALGIHVDAAAARPNVLLLFVDDMGYSDTAAFGSPNVSTPHLDGLIHSGVKFTQWISAASICTPSRAALQTGRYALRTGCTGVEEARRVIPTPSNPGGLDPAQHMSLATALGRAGYSTGMAGKWHLGINEHEQARHFTPVAVCASGFELGSSIDRMALHPLIAHLRPSVASTATSRTSARLTRMPPCAKWERMASRTR